MGLPPQPDPGPLPRRRPTQARARRWSPVAALGGPFPRRPANRSAPSSERRPHWPGPRFPPRAGIGRGGAVGERRQQAKPRRVAAARAPRESPRASLSPPRGWGPHPPRPGGGPAAPRGEEGWGQGQIPWGRPNGRLARRSGAEGRPRGGRGGAAVPSCALRLAAAATRGAPRPLADPPPPPFPGAAVPCAVRGLAARRGGARRRPRCRARPCRASPRRRRAPAARPGAGKPRTGDSGRLPGESRARRDAEASVGLWRGSVRPQNLLFFKGQVEILMSAFWVLACRAFSQGCLRAGSRREALRVFVAAGSVPLRSLALAKGSAAASPTFVCQVQISDLEHPAALWAA